MSDPTWEDGNNRVLAERVARLRALLEHRARRVRSASEPPRADDERSKSSWWGRRTPQLPPATVVAVPVDPPAGEAPPRGDAADLKGETFALQRLTQTFGLTPFEEEIIVLCAAMELDTGMGSLCAQVMGDPARTQPTFGLAFSLLERPTWDALSPVRPLRWHRLVEVVSSGQPLTSSPIRIDERVLNYLKGYNHLDERLEAVATLLDAPDEHLPAAPSQRVLIEGLASRLRHFDRSAAPVVVQLLGRDSFSKRLVARSVGAALGFRLLAILGGLVPTAAGDLEALARLWQRELKLAPLATYVDGQAMDDTTHGPSLGAVARWIGRVRGVVFVDAREPWPELPETAVTLDVGKPTASEQQSAWARALGPNEEGLAARLAGQFDMNIAHIFDAVVDVLETRPPDDAGVHDRLWDRCVAHARPRLDALAARIDAKATWDDIVLPEAELDLLHQIADQVKNRAIVYQSWGFADRTSRGLGISVLFAGDSGTGKTMAAEVLANDLRLNLHKIDLSAVVSKYIGETEKNLRRVFDAAEDGGAILFFDEADALFGKRTEVKDSHDRYANIEINYLLQRMEAYRGLAILATNMKRTMDPAFLRRLRFVVNFPFPGAAERARIWGKAFPKSTPTDGLDFERLGRLNLTGGQVANIALNAAFLAERSGGRVAMDSVLKAARAEFRKLERPIHEQDFRAAAAPVGGGTVRPQ
jgi:hypothetical protein